MIPVPPPCPPYALPLTRVSTRRLPRSAPGDRRIVAAESSAPLEATDSFQAVDHATPASSTVAGRSPRAIGVRRIGIVYIAPSIDVRSPIVSARTRLSARALGHLSLLGALWLVAAVLGHALYHLVDEALATRVPSTAVRVILLSALIATIIRLTWTRLTRGPAPGLPRSVTLLLWVALVLVADVLLHKGVPAIEADMRALEASSGLPALLIAAVVYAIVLSLPFMPGMEIGLLIMLLFGPPGAVAAWAATISGLALSFTVGRLLPDRFLRTLISRMGTVGSATGGPGMPPLLTRLTRLPARHPYLVVAMAVNMPGNAVVGGGGGIALIAGAAKNLSAIRFLVTVALATLPIPLLVALGYLSVGRLID